MAVKNNREGVKPAKIKKRFVRYREGAELYSMSVSIMFSLTVRIVTMS